MTTAELEQLLASKRKKEQKEKQRLKEKYEAEREQTIEYLFANAKDLHHALARFKKEAETHMQEQAKALQDYGALRSNSKGGFSIITKDGNYKIKRRRDTTPTWDERSTKASELIKDFLGDTVKKKDKELYEILLSFLAKNDAGDLEYARVMNLFQHQDKFNDPRWIEGLGLIKESYSTHLKAFGYEFQEKQPDGSYKTLSLNFSSL